VSLGDETAIARRALTVSYTYRVLIQQQSHLLELDISRPTKGLRVELAYVGASSRQPGLTHLPPAGRWSLTSRRITQLARHRAM
jgi:hypothetical protein